VNLVVTNRLTAPLAPRLPWFCLLEHVGRRSGKVRHTPMNVFRIGDRYVFALTYGPEVQWVANVLAAGECRIKSGGRWIRLVEPRRFTDTARRRVPWIVRIALRLIGVTEFLEMRRVGAS
jgi:deazaflavin-dependent oxidoreductase (nitroreductase family)